MYMYFNLSCSDSIKNDSLLWVLFSLQKIGKMTPNSYLFGVIVTVIFITELQICLPEDLVL